MGQLTCLIESGYNLSPVAGKSYRVRVKAVGEKESNYSAVSTFILEQVPAAISISTATSRS